MIRANGFTLCVSNAALFASTIEAVPSLIPDELPAVTNPSLVNAACKLARLSVVVSGRINSSVSNVTVLRRVVSSKAVIWLLKYPASLAWAARACERLGQAEAEAEGRAVAAEAELSELRQQAVGSLQQQQALAEVAAEAEARGREAGAEAEEALRAAEG